MKRALVTGGAGFIGSHLCKRLIVQGYFVYCADNLYSGNFMNIKDLATNPNFVFINSDVTTLYDLEVHEIYNLACPASPIHYQANPMFTLHTSINGAIQMAQLAQKLRIKLFHASTSEIYGEPSVHPQPENYFGNVNPIGPRACYDEGKRVAETILFIHYQQQKFPLKIARIFNTYGPNMQIDDGRAVSNFINQALRNKDLTVFGDGTQTRSFCYIDDLIDAILKFMQTTDEVTGPLNLGNAYEYTILEMARLIIKLTASHSKIVHAPLPQDDPTHRRPDLTLAKKFLDWEPEVSLITGLHKTIEYFKKSSKSKKHASHS